MSGDLFYCSSCELVYLERDTVSYYSPGFSTPTGARQCDVCATKLARLDLDEVDLGVVDYLA